MVKRPVVDMLGIRIINSTSSINGKANPIR